MQTAKLTEQETAAALIEELKAATLVSGESEAQRALVGSEERAQTILAEADAIGAGGEPASVVAQREAAHRIAQHAADKCRETGDNLASDVREEATLHTGNYDELLQSFFDRLEQTVADADASLMDLLTTPRESWIRGRNRH